ncbi:MAG: trypsin-like peptidase domain-containing protein [Desulfobacterales bacterium]|nr:trypsin-like peptidase domain-containing protein [Desulfobacterales bacterium]
MKRCTSCDQILGQKVNTCPACGSKLVAGITHIDNYRIQAIIHEGRSSIVCKAIRKDAVKSVNIRLFTNPEEVNQAVAKRLDNEIKELRKLPPKYFVQHYAMKQSQTGQWYRVSEWVDAKAWSDIFVSGDLNDQRRVVYLFHQIAKALDTLNAHDHFMPYLILEDILIPKEQTIESPVKINYKLSRFLNARATHHPPMLKRLLDCHPDIINQRVIDFKSGIWSLGKVFLEILTADDSLTRFSSRVDEIKGLHPDLAVLIKIMLSDDPSLRPKTMRHVADALMEIMDKMPNKLLRPFSDRSRPRIVQELNWFKRLSVYLLILIAGIVVVNTLSWVYLRPGPEPKDSAVSTFVETYADSIGFIMVEYWLADGERVVYKNKVEGTAFLADKEGYLLTNRHVACPWLEDSAMFGVYRKAQAAGRPLTFDHRMFLWFEGEKAFNRLPDLRTSRELSDSYFLASAYRSDGKSNLRIVGVPRGAGEPGEIIRSPFKHDFAVLKIDTIPEELVPLPLDRKLDAGTLNRLSPVIILGFPLGNRTQVERINASVTRGHIRRTSREIIQVDSSIYKGNSGGPAINNRGVVIGIASGVVTDQTSPQLPVISPLSDFGLVLPISRPAQFMAELKEGQIKWNGILDFSLPIKLKKVMDKALEHQYATSATLTDILLEDSKDPSLLLASGVLHFCNNAFDKSRMRLKRLLSVEGENTTASLLLYIMDWLENSTTSKSQTRVLFEMDWQDKDEFFGYMAGVLENKTPMDDKFIEYENRSEYAWRLFMDGLILEKKNETPGAREKYRESILLAGPDDFLYFLAFSRLHHLWDQQSESDTPEFKQMIQDFTQTALRARKQTQIHEANLNSLLMKFESQRVSYDQKIDIYAQLQKMAPENRTIIGRIAFFHAMNGEWNLALEFIDQFFKQPARESALGLSLGLMKGEILNIQGRTEEAKAYLTDFQEQTQSSWYSIISKSLLMGPEENRLVKLAARNPQKLITLQTALGLWAEGNEDRKRAAHHYREALSTYLEEWNEYDLALRRIMRFRNNQE